MIAVRVPKHPRYERDQPQVAINVSLLVGYRPGLVELAKRQRGARRIATFRDHAGRTAPGRWGDHAWVSWFEAFARCGGRDDGVRRRSGRDCDEPTTQEAVAHALQMQRVPAPAEPPANIAPVEVEVGAADAEGSVQLANGRDVTVTAADVDGSVVKERADGVQVLTVLKHGDSAADFQIGLPIGIVLTRVGEGYEITDPSGHVVYGQIAKPWAIDAQGKRLATRYELHGATIVQKVNTTGAAFPVVADPYIQRSWWRVTVKFTKRETLTMATGAGAVAWIATSIPDSTVSKIIAVAAGGIALHATIARAYGKCVAVKKPWYGPLIPWYWSC